MRKGVLFLIVASILVVNVVFGQSDTTIPPGFYDDVMPLIDFDGAGWTRYSCSSPCAYYNSSMWTNSFVDVVEFSFIGEELTVYHATGSGSGSATMCVDVACLLVDMYSASASYLNSVTFNGFGDGTHVFTMQKSSNDGFFINLDAILIVGEIQPESTQEIIVNVTVVLPETTPEPTPAWLNGYTLTDPDGNEQDVVFEYSVRVGEIVVSVLAFAILLSLFIGYAFNHSRRK